MTVTGDWNRETNRRGWQTLRPGSDTALQRAVVWPEVFGRRLAEARSPLSQHSPELIM